MAYSLDEVVGRYPTMARFNAVVLPVTPIPRVLGEEPSVFPAVLEANIPVGETVRNKPAHLAAVRQGVFGDLDTLQAYSVGDVTGYTVLDVPKIHKGKVDKEDFDMYLVRGDLAPATSGVGVLMQTALYQASLARAFVSACVLTASDDEPSEELLKYLQRTLMIDPFTPIDLQVLEGDRVPVFADRQSAVDNAKPKTLSAASSFALLLYQTAKELAPNNWLSEYNRLFNAMPPDKRETYQQLVGILRDDQFGGYEDEFRAPNNEREDILPSDPLYALVHLGDALYRTK